MLSSFLYLQQLKPPIYPPWRRNFVNKSLKIATFPTFYASIYFLTYLFLLFFGLIALYNSSCLPFDFLVFPFTTVSSYTNFYFTLAVCFFSRLSYHLRYSSIVSDFVTFSSNPKVHQLFDEYFLCISIHVFH